MSCCDDILHLLFQERRLEDVTKTLSGGDAKSKTNKKQQKSNQQPMHNNNKTGNSSSSGSDSSDSSSSSSEESDSDSEPETKQASNSLPRSNEAAQKLPHNSGPVMPPQQQQQPLPQAIPHPDSMLGNNLKVRNDLMPGGRMSENTTPNSLLQQHHQLLQQQQQQQQQHPQPPQQQPQQPFPQSNYPGGVVPLQPAARQYNASVMASQQQQQSPSPTQLLQQQQQQQQQQLAKMNSGPGALSHLSTAMNSSNNEIPSIDSPAGPQKTKAMLKGWSSLAGPGSAGTIGSGGGPVPSMTGPVSGVPMQVNPAHHGVPAAVGPAPEHLSRLSNVNKSQFLQQKASDTFNAFRKAAQEKTERERQLKEQQESIRMKKEAAERERKRQENERRREQAEEEMLEQARRSMQMGRPGFPPNSAMDNGNGASTGISPSGLSPATTEAARAQLLRQREREKEQERRRREAKAGGIDMNMQSDLMAAFEENII